MSIRYAHSAGPVAAAAAGLSLVALTACSRGSASSAPPGSGGTTTSTVSGVSAVTGPSSGKTIDGCPLVTAQQLSAAAGVKYTAIRNSSGSICNLTGADPADAFYHHADKEDGTLTTWSGELAVIKEDDGSYTSVSGIGDRAAEGAVKEFAAESDGYIIVVVQADINNPATAASFARTRKIEQLLISKV